MGPFHEWRVDVVSGIRLHVGLWLSMGLDAVPLRFLVVPACIWMGVAAWILDGMATASARGKSSAAVCGAASTCFAGADGDREPRSFAGPRHSEADDRAQSPGGVGNSARQRAQPTEGYPAGDAAHVCRPPTAQVGSLQLKHVDHLPRPTVRAWR